MQSLSVNSIFESILKLILKEIVFSCNKGMQN